MAERALREFRTQVEDEMRDTASPARTTTTLERVAEKHLAYLGTVLRRRQRTVVGYESMLRVHIVPYFAGKDVASITRADVEGFMADLVSRRPRGTMLNVVNLLDAVLDEALRDGLVRRTPFRRPGNRGPPGRTRGSGSYRQQRSKQSSAPSPSARRR